MPKKISRASKRGGDRTLVVDIGASGIKALVLDAAGRPLTVRERIKTPSPSTPSAVLSAIGRLVRRQGRFDRVAVGFPGVIRNGVVETASNLGLDQKWCGFRLAEKLESKLGRPVRVANDADLIPWTGRLTGGCWASQHGRRLGIKNGTSD
jgi:polyphosphate glucokinase